jgi:hypothetical protein
MEPVGMTKASVTNSFRSNTRTTTKTIVSIVSRMGAREEGAEAEGEDAASGLAAVVVVGLAAVVVVGLAGMLGTAGAAWLGSGVGAWLSLIHI